MLLSIIIPFYGVEKYISACLRSIEVLSSSDCEVLLVDDCGNDGSLKIASDWVSCRKNARLIRRENNGGLSAARNSGLLQAKGDYVYFLDSDDIPEANGILELAEVSRKMNLDVAKGSFLYFDDEAGNEWPGPKIVDSGVMKGKKLFAEECKRSVYEPMVWQCIYRKAFLENINLKMAEHMLFEDELFQAPALIKANRAASKPVCLLHYRQRPGSIMRSFSKNAEWCEHYLEICRRLTKLERETDGEAAEALRNRKAEIALSIGKNIIAYKLKGQVAAEALAFLKRNKMEISSYASGADRIQLIFQSKLFSFSPDLFLKFYQKMKR